MNELESNQTNKATPHVELIEDLLNSSLPKSETEWAASREIKSLRKALEKHEALIVCGENSVFPPERVGCGDPIWFSKDIFKCTHCNVPFHKMCATKHFGEAIKELK